MKAKLMLYLCLILVSATAFGQGNITVTGVVTEKATDFPAVGVSVLVKGTTNGTVTSLDGDYSLTNVPANGTLVFSYVGMLTQEIQVNSRTSINVFLEDDTKTLDEVVVIGYGTTKAKDLTSAITTIKADEIMKTPAGQAMNALQGKVAGLQVISSGGPGNSPTVRLRGVGSYPKGSEANDAPLYVVDGIFYDNIDFLNTADIASMNVLKDASAAAIYGVRAANGVVLIETKAGGYDKKTEVTIDTYYGVQRAQNVLKMANAEQYVAMAMASGSATDAANVDAAMLRYGRSRVNPNLPNVNTDWYDEIIRLAPVQNYTVDVSGGTSKASYSVGASYFEQEGILDMKNDYNRFNLRSKLDFKATDWLTLGANFIWSQATKHPEDASAWNAAYFAVPILPVWDETNNNYANAKDLGYRNGQTPFTALKYTHNQHEIDKLMASVYAKIDLLPNNRLSFKTSYNSANTDLDERDVALPYNLGNSVQRVDASITKRMKSYTDIAWDNVLTYSDQYGEDHALTVMAGSSFRDFKYQYLEAVGLNFPAGHEESWYINQATEKKMDGLKGGGTRQYGMSYFGRVSYNFKQRYLLYATMRADGSSKYQEKWGYFPSVGIGWVISDEAFLKDIKEINLLKLRASWGKLGNENIPASDGAYSTNIIYTAIGGNRLPGTTVSGVYSTLKWELTEETNVGVSGKFLGNRLGLEADYFIRDTKNAAIDVTIPAIGGTVMRNVGVIRNSGFELALNWEDRLTKDFSYYIGGNISTLKNEVRDLYGQPYIDGGTEEFRQRSYVGEPLLSFYGYKVTGVYQNQAEIDADPIAVANGLVPGDFKYQNTNGDDVLDGDDRVLLGSYFPTFMYGANLGASYKDFDLSISLIGQTGNKILNRKRGEYIWTNDTNIDADLASNLWTGEGTSNKYPSSSGLRRGWNQKMSTYFVESGAFFRIQNIQIGYNIVNKQAFGVKLPQMRVSLTADRPLTVFGYNGFNPEVPNGIDTQTYPIPATYTVGLNIKF